jgi:hypothetical protein
MPVPPGNLQQKHLLKMQRVQKRVLRTIGNFLRHTSISDMHVAFHVPNVYDYITELCRRQAKIIHNHENENVRNTGQGETPHRNYKRLILGGGHLQDRSSVLHCHGSSFFLERPNLFAICNNTFSNGGKGEG